MFTVVRYYRVGVAVFFVGVVGISRWFVGFYLGHFLGIVSNVGDDRVGVVVFFIGIVGVMRVFIGAYVGSFQWVVANVGGGIAGLSLLILIMVVAHCIWFFVIGMITMQRSPC